MSERVQELLAVFSGPGANAARLLCDAHPPQDTAFTFIAADLSSHDMSYGELREKSTRFAAALSSVGVGRGDHVATLMGKSAELVVALLGIWRLGAVHVPLFTAFAHDAIAFRLQSSGARLVVCDAGQRRKLVPPGEVPTDASIPVVVAGGEAFGYDHSFAEMVAGTGSFTGAGTMDDGGPATVGGSGTLVQLFTSGTTGAPKGVGIPLRAVASFVGYLEFALDVRDDDVFWNMADPGWAYGLYFAILAPLAAGRRSLLLSAGFSAELTWSVMDRFQVSNFAAAPTVYRSLRAGSAPGHGHRLRRASSAGEPLTPEVIEWGRDALGVEVRDHYGQTELGMVAGNAWSDALRAPLRPGSMGRPLPGWSVEVLAQDADEPAENNEQGRVAVNVPNSPFMWFDAYLQAPEKTAQTYSADGVWYLTGDVAHRDADGCLFFRAREDDVIIMSGYRIGPFDVESVLLKHPAVAAAAAVGAPDPLRGEALEAFVVLRAPHGPSAELERELQQLVKDRFAAHAFPRRIHFVAELPTTPSGKIQRHLLRRQLGK